MADFQHVVPVHAAETRKRKHPECPNNKEHLCNGSLPSDPVLSHAMPDSNIS
jgi:hypothetical protein